MSSGLKTFFYCCHIISDDGEIQFFLSLDIVYEQKESLLLSERGDRDIMSVRKKISVFIVITIMIMIQHLLLIRR